MLKNFNKIKYMACLMALSSFLVTACCKKVPVEVLTPLSLEQVRQEQIANLEHEGVEVNIEDRTVTIKFPQDVLFPENCRLNPECEHILDIAADLISTYDKVDVKVLGAQPAAHIVSNYLWDRNINARFISAKRDQQAINEGIIEVCFHFYPPYIPYE